MQVWGWALDVVEVKPSSTLKDPLSMVLSLKIIRKTLTKAFILQKNANETEASIQAKRHAEPAKAHSNHSEESS